jgi:hypothetical protein
MSNTFTNMANDGSLDKVVWFDKDGYIPYNFENINSWIHNILANSNSIDQEIKHMASLLAYKVNKGEEYIFSPTKDTWKNTYKWWTIKNTEDWVVSIQDIWGKLWVYSFTHRTKFDILYNPTINMDDIVRVRVANWDIKTWKICYRRAIFVKVILFDEDVAPDAWGKYNNNDWVEIIQHTWFTTNTNIEELVFNFRWKVNEWKKLKFFRVEFWSDAEKGVPNRWFYTENIIVDSIKTEKNGQYMQNKILDNIVRLSWQVRDEGHHIYHIEQIMDMIQKAQMKIIWTAPVIQQITENDKKGFVITANANLVISGRNNYLQFWIKSWETQANAVILTKTYTSKDWEIPMNIALLFETLRSSHLSASYNVHIKIEFKAWALVKEYWVNQQININEDHIYQINKQKNDFDLETKNLEYIKITISNWAPSSNILQAWLRLKRITYTYSAWWNNLANLDNQIAMKAKTDKLNFTSWNNLDANLIQWNSSNVDTYTNYITKIVNDIQAWIINEWDGKQVLEAIWNKLKAENITDSAIATEVINKLKDLNTADITTNNKYLTDLLKTVNANKWILDKFKFDWDNIKVILEDISTTGEAKLITWVDKSIILKNLDEIFQWNTKFVWQNGSDEVKQSEAYGAIDLKKDWSWIYRILQFQDKDWNKVKIEDATKVVKVNTWT